MPKKAKPTFEEDLARLTEIVNLLEDGPETLDEMLALYEEGVGVTRRLEKTLDEAETRVKSLSRDERGELNVDDWDDAS
ncbi:MAG: exodeoxyribonuclease VII small subunit [candidate division Zixibacteria bacterium]|nr:exodeoxyribonuclease VII small subunit [candidate division Zixibacteria bacterium]